MRHPKNLITYILLGGVVLLSASQTACTSEQETGPPNIIFLLTDDQTDIATGCYGNPQLSTPNMDQLANEGIRFANYYNTTSICMASRATIMTGMYEYSTGCNFKHGPLKAELFSRSYPVFLRQAGYHTGFAGKFGFGVKESGDEDYGNQEDLPADAFDVWAGGPGQTSYVTANNKLIKQYAEKYPHSSRAYGAWAHDFMAGAKETGKPFCMSISFKAPHLPFTPDPLFDSVYAGKKYSAPANYGVENAAHLSEQARSGRQFRQYRFWVNSEESYQENIRKYNQLIHGVDHALGMIRNSLEELGLSDNTVIIFTSDNGYSCGAHGFGGKVLPYEEASRSPLIIYDPRFPVSQKGLVRNRVTGNIDMAPTILSYAGLPVPAHMHGENLIPLMKDENGLDRETISLFNMWGHDEIQAMTVVSDEWKYIYWQYEDERMQPAEELFNIGRDRQEMKNLAGEEHHLAKLEEMREIYDEHLQHIEQHGVDFHDYAKYPILFSRTASAEEKKPFLIGTFEETEKVRLERAKLKKKN